MEINSNPVLRRLLFPIIWMTKVLGRYCPALLVRIRYFARFHKCLDLKDPR